MPKHSPTPPSARRPAASQGPSPSLFWVAAALALASAVSLGLARFSYALLLPAMREDLGWSYFTAGAMNTANAAGYLGGALLAPVVLRRIDARRFMLAGGAAAAVLLMLHAAVRQDSALYALRWACGAASAASFVGGGLLAARLAQRSPERSGLVLGVYYGGVGLGIVASALGVPSILQASTPDRAAWPGAWLALGVLALLLCLLTAAATGSLAAPPTAGAARAPFPLRRFVAALVGYSLFGIGYIGYMTFVITLLREQGLGAGAVIAFYVVLGLGVIASSWVWSGLLQRHRGGWPLALLNALLALATALPLLSSGLSVAMLSGALFGGVFLSLVASTTALVRHNTPPAAWPSGIAAFTVVFAAGQIVGPSMVGWIADGPGGLARGFAFSAAALALGAVAAVFQRPLPSR